MIGQPFPLTEPEYNIRIDAYSGTVEGLAEKIQETLKEQPAALEQFRRFISGGEKRQSGMEGKHEQWIMAILNFLNKEQIPFYKYDERGNKLRGAAGEREIPERLELLKKNYMDNLRLADAATARERGLRETAELRIQELEAQITKLETKEAPAEPPAAHPLDPSGS